MIRVKHKYITIITRFFVVIVICIAIILGLKMFKEEAVTLHTKKTLIVTIDLNQREKFFEQLTRFADVHDFDIHIGATTPAGDTFNINISSKDLMIIADNVFEPKSTFDIDFYDKNPHNPTSEEVIDSLFNDLKRFISEVPNIKIIDGT